MRSLGTHGLFWLARAEGCSRLLPLGFPSSSLGLPCVFFQLDAARASPDARAVWQAPWLAMPHAGTLSAKLKWSRARVARCVHCSARVERLQRQRTEPASAVAGALKVLPSRARASSPSRRTLPGANAGWVIGPLLPGGGANLRTFAKNARGGGLTPLAKSSPL